MIATLLNRPCTITRRSPSGDTDGYGNAIPDEVEVETVCEIQQRQAGHAAEAGLGGEVSDTYWLGVFLAGTVLRTSDKVTVDDEDYELVGDPWKVRSPLTRTEHHVEATLRRIAGADDEVGS